MKNRIRRYGRETFASLKIRNYRLYFIGQGISQCGTWMQVVALGWLVLTLTGSGTQLGTVLALQFLPLFQAQSDDVGHNRSSRHGPQTPALSHKPNRWLNPTRLKAKQLRVS